MPVDPVIRTVLDALAAMGAPPMSEGTPDEARVAFRKLSVGMRQPSQVVPVGEVLDTEVAGADGPLAARVYRPEASGPLPTVLFLHGGGFVIGDLDTHDNQARAVCAGAEAVVVSVAYRLAPEHPWPAAAEDAVAALRAVHGDVRSFGGDPDLVGIAGDSAGGNLAAVAAQAARDEGIALAAQLLVYPAVDFLGDHASREQNADGFLLTADDMRWFAEHYVGAAEGTTDPQVLGDPRMSPLHADLAGLAPAVVITAEFDPLRDEGDAYARALAAAGVPVDHLPSDGMIHGFFDMFPYSPGARTAVDAAIAAFARRLRGALAPSGVDESRY